MRDTYISNTTLYYPDDIAWLHDNVCIVLESVGFRVGASIRVTDTHTGIYRKLTHYSELNRVVFPLNDTLMSLYSGSDTYNIVVDVYENETIVDSFGFDQTIYNGTSQPLRAHGSTRTIYAYDEQDLYKIQLLLPTSGNVNVNGHSYPVLWKGITGFDVRDAVDGNGTYPMCYFAGAKGDSLGIDIVNVKNITPFSAVAELEYKTESGDVPEEEKQKGGIWADTKFEADDFCAQIIYEEACDDFNFFKVRYLDTDGCLRYLGGKIISDTTNASGDNYYRLDTGSVYRNISRRRITSSSGTVKVGYGLLRRDSYWTDILLADKVEFRNYNGDWVECSVVSDSVTVKSDESDDVTLEFQLFVN